MITLNLVTLEQAKLLKELGYNLYCKFSYYKNGITELTPGYATEDGVSSELSNYTKTPRYYAPEQHTVLEWLIRKSFYFNIVTASPRIHWVQIHANWDQKMNIFKLFYISGTAETQSGAISLGIDFVLDHLIKQK